jgi:hypothetical protein
MSSPHLKKMEKDMHIAGSHGMQRAAIEGTVHAAGIQLYPKRPKNTGIILSFDLINGYFL